MIRGKIDLTLSLNDHQNQNDIINKKDFKIIYSKIEKLDVNKDVSKDVIFNNSMNIYDKKISTKHIKRYKDGLTTQVEYKIQVSSEKDVNYVISLIKQRYDSLNK